ncbi:MAG: lytic transglycosylase domain-containing protein [Deltaproteobacteria bacterium]|jgi:soluble lytic murein transglycosylase-like protein|nr:lytic transglycosylase domain-containing protein [Deltaproteobacteria bacterium]
MVNRVPSARSGQFQEILSRLKVRNSKKPYKTRGLTIADYRARAIIPKSRYRRLAQSVDAPIKNPVAINGFKKIHNRFPVQSAKISTLPAPNRKFIDKVPFETQLDKVKPQPVALTDRQMIEQTVKKAAAKYNLPPALITAVIRAESNFKVRAVSSAGAQGLMQLMPATARELGVKNPFDIGQNIDGGAKYLRKMLDRFGGSLRKALAAYNAGPGTVMKYDGRVPYRETRQYVRRVLRFSGQLT